jgi:peptidoglycan/LPS O-acetylase OafA/YrhL
MLAAVSVWVALAAAGQLVPFRQQALAAALYVSNWWTIAQSHSYFSRFAAPLPLDHMWSLAIEEQFYLVWPCLLWLGLWATRRGGRRPVTDHLALVTIAFAVVSAIAMALLYRRGYDPTRVYEGTDTRAFGLLVGAAVAMVWPIGRLRRDVRPLARDLLDSLGSLGLGAIAVLVWRTDPYSPFLYRGGMILLSLATAAVVIAVVHPATRLSRALGWAPLLWVGVRSYGIYLWHWPIIVLTSPPNAPVEWLRATLQVAATLVVAGLSWRSVEEPIRRLGIKGAWSQARAGARSVAGFRHKVAVGATVTISSVAILGIAGFLPAYSGHGGGLRGAEALAQGSLPVDGSTTGADTPAGASVASPIASASATPAKPKRTSCTSVVYMGESTSNGMISALYIPHRSQRLPARLARVGVEDLDVQISGARSIVETYQGIPNAATVAQRLVDEGFRGCWVLALGTNDTANVAVGSPIDRPTRIARMMTIVGHRPVLWIGTASLLRSGPYSASMMGSWNRALLGACSRFPQMRVFDWSALAKPSWFTPDALHYNSLGSIRRSQLIARALVSAFPEGTDPSLSCVVR